MEFTKDLSIFEGIIDSANDVITLSDMIEKSGHEHELKYLLDCVQKFLLEVEYKHNGTYLKEVYDKLCQLALYIILNSDLQVLENMKEHEGLELLIGTLPMLPRYVMCEILWYLEIDKIISEILVHSYPLMALDIADALIEHCKYFNPDTCLPKIKLLTISCYKMLFRMFYFNLNEETVKRAYNNFQKSLTFFIKTPNMEKLDKLSEDDLYKYMGNQIYIYLEVLYECLSVFTKKEQFKTLEIKSLFLFTIKPNIIKSEEICFSKIHNDGYMSLVQDCLLKSNTALLETCESLLSEISVDIFCSWSEFEENGISLQNSIGELGYRITSDLYEFINNDEKVWTMLQLFSRKPIDYTKEINEVDSKTIAEKVLEDGNNSNNWIKALIYRDNLCCDNNLITLLLSKVNLLNSNESHKLYNILYEHLTSDVKENIELIKSLTFKCFEMCTNEVKHELVQNHFCNNTFNDKLNSEIFEVTMTEVFNKLVSSPEYDLTQIYVVFLQNPKKVFAEILILATKNNYQTSIMTKLMIFLKRYSFYEYENENESCVLLIVRDIIENNLPSDRHRDNLIEFIHQLKDNNILNNLKLLLIIMPNIYNGVKHYDVDKLNFHCKLLLKAYKTSELVEYRAPMLVMLAQVAEVARWQINTFTTLKPILLDLVVELITSIIDTYNSKIPEKDLEWLKMKLAHMNQLNMYYYKCVWGPAGDTFVGTVSGTQVHQEMDLQKTVLWLSQQFCSTSLQEWYKIWDSFEIFESTKTLDLFHEAVMRVAEVELSNRSEPTESCLLHTLKNYTCVIKNKFWNLPLDEGQVMNVLRKLTALENTLQVSNIEEVEIILLPLFSFISERKNDYNVDVSEYLQDRLKHQQIKDMCSRFFVKYIPNFK